MVSEKWYTYKDGEKMNIIFILILMKFSKQKKRETVFQTVNMNYILV